MKLYHYVVKIYRTPGIYEWNSDKFINEQVDVLAQNETYILINDWYFTKIRKKKCDYDSYLNKPSIRIRTNDNIMDNGIFYDLYSEKPVKPSKIKSEIQAKISKDYSWLLGGVDLSIIK